MDADTIRDAAGRLDELAGAGGIVGIAREGRVVLRLVQVTEAAPPFDRPAYFASIKNMPAYDGDTVVAMRHRARCW